MSEKSCYALSNAINAHGDEKTVSAFNRLLSDGLSI